MHARIERKGGTLRVFLCAEIFLFFQEALNRRTRPMSKSVMHGSPCTAAKGNLVDFLYRASQMLWGGAGLHTSIFVASSPSAEATPKPPYRQGNGSERGVLQIPYTQLASSQRCGWAYTEYSLQD